jgi:hypothetical protein
MLAPHDPVARTIALCSGGEIAWASPGAAAAGHPHAAVAWLAMVLAMAPLLLRAEIGLLRIATVPRRRASALAAFIAGYALPWLLLGLVALTAPIPGATMLAGAAVLVLAWQCSPWRQWALNACHARPSLRAFGLAMLADAAHWGGRTGACCVAVCGPAMLLAMSLPAFHAPAMAAAVLLGLVERRRPPRRPAWRPPLMVRDARPWESRTMSAPSGG